MRISVTRKNLFNIKDEYIEEYALMFGEDINTDFCRYHMASFYDLHSDKEIDKFFEDKGQEALDKKINDSIYEELHLEDEMSGNVLQEAWKAHFNK